LRDSAGFAPDFAVSAPAGDMCPTIRAYANAKTSRHGGEAGRALEDRNCEQIYEIARNEKSRFCSRRRRRRRAGPST
jgi:hypothetical protein